MGSKVFFAKFDDEQTSDSAPELIGTLFDKAGFADVLEDGDLALIKLHFGEEGNKGYIKPPLVRTVVERCRKTGAKPFLCDTNTLYIHNRHNAVDHLMLASKHGFSVESIGCPVIIADGLRGRNTVEIKIKGKHSESVNVSPDAVHADAIIGLSHVTGHIGTGLGATIKNIGMGLSSRAGKLIQHCGEAPSIDSGTCTGCGTCARWCPEQAISVAKDRATIDSKACISCGYCICLCREGAVRFSWTGDNQYLQERVAEHAAGALSGKEGKSAFINVIIDSSEKCDCMSDTGKKLIKDLGILASKDPVALDSATADIINETAGTDIFTKLYPDIDYRCQLRHASGLGLGNCDYDLTVI